MRDGNISSQMTDEIVRDLYLYHDGFNRGDYEKRWDALKARYDSIRVFRMKQNYVGELIPRVTSFLHEKSRDESILRVILPVMDNGEDRICSTEVIKLLAKEVHIPYGEDILFWAYVLKNHAEELDTNAIDRYAERNYLPAYEVPAYRKLFTFTNEQIERGEARLKELGIVRPYVCLAARTAEYNLNTLRDASHMEYEYSYRHMEFSDYGEAISYLRGEGFHLVRMGRGKPLSERYDGLVDYAGSGGDEFMDLYILANAKGMILNSFGIWSIASLFGTPILMVNHMPYCCGYGGARFTDRDMYLPKKYYVRQEKRCLSLEEMADAEKACIFSWSKYKELGIDYIGNTQEEIRDAVREFIERIDGKWIPDADDTGLHTRYEEILEDVRKNTEAMPEMTTGCPVPGRIGTAFLRENRYLLGS